MRVPYSHTPTKGAISSAVQITGLMPNSGAKVSTLPPMNARPK